MSRKTVRVNWKQGKVASDGLIRLHKIKPTGQPKGCQFGAMSEFEDFQDESEAVAAIKQKGYTQYKHCSHCWDGETIQINA